MVLVGLEVQVINMRIDLFNNGFKPNKTEECDYRNEDGEINGK